MSKSLEDVKSRVYMHFLKELENKPNLEGLIIFSLKIEPNGSVSEVTIVTNELNSEELTEKIIFRKSFCPFQKSYFPLVVFFKYTFK